MITFSLPDDWVESQALRWWKLMKDCRWHPQDISHLCMGASVLLKQSNQPELADDMLFLADIAHRLHLLSFHD